LRGGVCDTAKFLHSARCGRSRHGGERLVSKPNLTFGLRHHNSGCRSYEKNKNAINNLANYMRNFMRLENSSRFVGKRSPQTTIKTAISIIAFFTTTAFALADCPPGTWPRDQYNGPGGGLYNGPGGGLYNGPGGGLYNGPGGGMYNGPGGGLYAGPGGGLYDGPGGGLYDGPGGGLYDGPGGGLYDGPGGGMYNGPGGGLYNGPGSYCTNRPPWPIILRYLQKTGKTYLAEKILTTLQNAGIALQ
jgi:hypothetical protein